MKEFLKENTFFLGVNYWASNAGTAMWKEWDESVVDSDCKKLAEAGVEVLRVFPLWEDFQPITMLFDCSGTPREMSHGEKFLSDDELGRSGVDPSAMEKFDAFLKIADKYGLKVIVGMITGWMSGREFYPPALRGKNVVTDPVCLKWEQKFIKYFVRAFKNRDCIIAWELGNECNCLARTTCEEEAWVWTSAIVNCIKGEDNTRPVLSGMHSLAVGYNWNIENQSELCDMLAIHPYMAFTPHCDLDPLISPRAIMHSPAEQALYADLGKRPCLVEEIGTLSSIFGCDEKVAGFVRANLFSAWANDGIGMMWWCGFDQLHLKHAPYDWHDVERELGMFYEDGSPKPVAEEYLKFNKFLKALPFEKLPSRKRDVLCLVSQSDWTIAFGSYICAKRAGIEIEYQSKKGTLKDAELYIVPGPETFDFIQKRTFEPLLQKVSEGAVCLITYDCCAIAPFDKIIGCKSLGRHRADALTTEIGGSKITLEREYAIDLQPVTARVAAVDQNGNPCLTVNPYGKGKIIFFNAPLEKHVAKTKGIASVADSGIEKLYEFALSEAGVKPEIKCDTPLLSVTVHPVSEKEYIAVIINDTENDLTARLDFNGRIKDVYYGEAGGKTVNVKSADAVVFSVIKD